MGRFGTLAGREGWRSMADSKKARIWVALLVGLAVFGAAMWLSERGSAGRSDPTPRSATGQGTASDTAPDATSSSATDPVPQAGATRIAEHGRLSMDVASVPTDGPLGLVLGLPDEARGDGPHIARVVSTDGRRLDTTATPLAGAGSGVQLDIDPGFLTPGLYMIEVQTIEKTPLHLRRYVLEVR
jgi:hypothetical protein